jgi:3',5'-cyclic AMP phosphodiesterase CpdA
MQAIDTDHLAAWCEWNTAYCIEMLHTGQVSKRPLAMVFTQEYLHQKYIFGKMYERELQINSLKSELAVIADQLGGWQSIWNSISHNWSDIHHQSLRNANVYYEKMTHEGKIDVAIDSYMHSPAMLEYFKQRAEQPVPAASLSASPRKQTQQRRVSDVKVRIIHLSDLHFGCFHQQEHPKEDRRMSPSEQFLRQFPQWIQKDEHVLILVSGDLVSTGAEKDPHEYEQAKDFLTKLTDILPTPTGNNVNSRHRIIITPGNHDVTWVSLNQVIKQGWPVMDVRLPLEKFQDAFMVFNNPTNSLTIPKQKSTLKVFNGSNAHWPLRAFLFPSLHVLVLPLISVFANGEFQQEYKEILSDLAKTNKNQLQKLGEIFRRTEGFFPEGYVNALGNFLGEHEDEWKKVPGLFRVAMVHHPLWQHNREKVDQPAGYQQIREVLNQYGFHATLSGHTHRWYSDIRDEYLPSVGPAEISAPSLCHYEFAQGFNCIELSWEDNKLVETKVRTYTRNPDKDSIFKVEKSQRFPEATKKWRKLLG